MGNTANINDHFFDGTYKEVWRHLIPQGLTEAETDFIETAASLQRGDAVLDIMCGYGRHALELSRKEYHVTAVDNSTAYINEIKDTVRNENLPLQTIQGSVIETDLKGYYKAVCCMGNSFAFFPKKDAEALLSKIAQHLLPGGSFILNTWMVAEIALHHFKPTEWYYAGPYKCILEYHYYFHPSRIESEQTIISDNGSIETIKGIDYIFSMNELEAMLQKAGLSIAGLYSTPRKRPFRLGDSRLYLVAEKA